MRSHLRKLIAFAAIQATLFAVVSTIAEPPAESRPDDGTALSAEARLARSLGEHLFRAWLADPATLQDAVERGARDSVVKDAFKTIRSDEDGYLMSILDKDQRLRTTPGRRLILLGGSNLPFGIDSTIFEERYGLVPVNLGLHEMLRADYQLRRTAEFIREGDVVIYCFEYGTLLSGGEASDPELRDRVCKILPTMRPYFADPNEPVDADGVQETGWKEYSDALALADFADRTRDVADRFHRGVASLPGRLYHRGLAGEKELRRRFDDEFRVVAPSLVAEYRRWIQDKDVYARSNFNEYGDVVGHYGLRSDRAIDPNGLGTLSDQQQDAVAKSFAILNRYTAELRAKGADVYFAYPPLCLDAGAPSGQEFETLVNEVCDATILFPIADAQTHVDEHYDTGYHLNWPGICRRMTVWTTALDRHLTPRTSLTPAEQVAARDRRIRTTVTALNAAAAPIVH